MVFSDNETGEVAIRLPVRRGVLTRDECGEPGELLLSNAGVDGFCGVVGVPTAGDRGGDVVGTGGGISSATIMAFSSITTTFSSSSSSSLLLGV